MSKAVVFIPNFFPTYESTPVPENGLINNPLSIFDALTNFSINL